MCSLCGTGSDLDLGLLCRVAGAESARSGVGFQADGSRRGLVVRCRDVSLVAPSGGAALGSPGRPGIPGGQIPKAMSPGKRGAISTEIAAGKAFHLEEFRVGIF